MPGNIYHYFIRDLKNTSKEKPEMNTGEIKNEEIKNIDFDNIWQDRYNIKPKLTMNERITKVYKALSNDFDFDLFY